MADSAEPRSEPPHGEVAVVVAVQTALATRPGVLTAARALSHFGEHSIGWLAVALLGAVAQPHRRRVWLLAGAGTFTAHAAAVLIKRLVRRPRPHHPAVAVNVGTPSRLSFPSAHATSTTAAAILVTRASGLPLPVVVVPPMALSRLLLGVHYPSDVVIGAAVGAAIAAVAIRLDDRLPGDAGRGDPRRSRTGKHLPGNNAGRAGGRTPLAGGTPIQGRARLRRRAA